jgi:RNAse (barnase) inhibitor barstar
VFKTQLGFPDWYGVGWVSWDAFWDCVVAGVAMPSEVRLINWQAFAAASPADMGILRQVIQDYAQEVPGKRIVLA